MSNPTTRRHSGKFTPEQESEICQRYQTPNEVGDYPTLVGLGAEYGCSETTIRNILKRHGVKTRPNVASYSRRMFDKETEIAICEYYWTKLPTGYYPSYQEVGTHFGCSGGQVAALLKRHGYESRTQAETRDHRPCKPIKNLPPEGEAAPLCKCGCGMPVEWNQRANRWQKFIPNHYVGMQRKLVQPHYTKVDKRTKEYAVRVYVPAQRLYTDEGRKLIEKLYIEERHTVKEVASILVVGPDTVRKALRFHDIPIRTTKESLILRGSTSGPNNPAWKGGVAKWNYSPDWKRLCKEIKDRDKWTCQLCGEQRKRWGHRLHVHHIDEDKMNNHPHNLISLCAACHAPLHGNEDIRPILVDIAIRNTNG